MPMITVASCFSRENVLFALDLCRQKIMAILLLGFFAMNVRWPHEWRDT